LARISQEVTERFYSLLAVGEDGRCLQWVKLDDSGDVCLKCGLPLAANDVRGCNVNVLT
jgi:hypothetical protein